MKINMEAVSYLNMIETQTDLCKIQERIYTYKNIPLEERDRLSVQLYELRMTLATYAIQLGDTLTDKDVEEALDFLNWR